LPDYDVSTHIAQDYPNVRDAGWYNSVDVLAEFLVVDPQHIITLSTSVLIGW